MHLHPADATPRAALVLGHGAGGGVDAPDLLAVTEAATASGITVALVEQPYRVAGRRPPAPARQLDENWVAIIAQLRAGPLADLPVVTGGRSMGARVACRTAAQVGAIGVACLAFPLVPPRRTGKPEPSSRLPELDALELPVVIIQGVRDPFGMPPARDGRSVIEVGGDHSLSSDVDAVTGALLDWIEDLLAAA
ncbi:MAG: hydrolase of the alpha/beta-hydrolase fold-like protein [Thermoleophilia bacterium]|nr:hydrolase of the alpha/beta-hydrolase fold-like protein [Thermoleophilia bacterium]